MRLELATWMEVDAYLKRSRGIIVPVGSTEQHGPTGLLGTDWMTAETIAHGIAERLDVLVTPTLTFGMAQHHLAFAGTISLRPTTLIAVVRDVVASLACHGFDRIYFVNGHGGNVDTVNAAFADIHSEVSFGNAAPSRRRVRCALRNWYESEGVESLSASFYGTSDGAHGTASEIAVTQFRYPDHIKTHILDPAVAPGLDREIHDAFDLRLRYPDGRIGSNPALATPEQGKILTETAIASLTADYIHFLDT